MNDEVGPPSFGQAEFPTRDGVPQLAESVVVYMDILGSTEMAQSPTAQDYLARLDAALKDTNGLLGCREAFERPYRLATFTDHVVLGWPIPGEGLRADAEFEIGATLIDLAIHQLELAKHGFFVRGALTCGLMYMGDDFVFGPGLIEAYAVESSIAVEPRIVLSKTAVNRVRSHLGYYAYREEAPQNRLMLVAEDEEVFLNYLAVCDDFGLDAADELSAHKAMLETRLAKWLTNRRVWSKYRWVADYHNYYCRTHHPTELGLIIEPDVHEAQFRTLAEVFPRRVK